MARTGDGLMSDLSPLSGEERKSGLRAVPNGHADPIERCPLLGEQRKTYARIELFRF